jgi:hypothetical protein
MTATLLLEQSLNGLQFGLMLFLLAAGLTLVFGIMDMINLAHGSLYMIGAYLVATITAASGCPTVTPSGYVNGPPAPVVVQLKLPVNVPAIEPVYETVTVPGTPAARFRGLGETLKPAPVAVQVTAAAAPVEVKLSEEALVLAGRLTRGRVTVVPETVHTEMVSEVNATVSPRSEVAVAVTVFVTPIVRLDIAEMLIVWEDLML